MDLDKRSTIYQKAKTLEVDDIYTWVLENPEILDKEEVIEIAKAWKVLQKIKEKLPAWFEKEGVLGLESINVEQSSSQITANLKFQGYQVQHAIDLTTGMGVDALALSKICTILSINERNEELLSITAHNLNLFDVRLKNIFNLPAEEIDLHDYDLIYLDPDRRPNNKDLKMIRLEDCTPNLVDLQENCLKKEFILISKHSPMLDITAAWRELKMVHKIQLIAVKNELKELVFHQGKDVENCLIETFNVHSNTLEKFSCLWPPKKETLSFSHALTYIYEPNAALMKTGVWWEISTRFNFSKLAPNTHFFTSDVFSKEFPGRIFKVEKVYKYNKKTLQLFKDLKANIISRNFPISAEELRKKTKIKEGLRDFLLFTKSFKGEKICIHCTKINHHENSNI